MPEFSSREAYHKVAKLDSHLASLAETTRGMMKPQALLQAIDAHAQGLGQWLKVAGMEKA